MLTQVTATVTFTLFHNVILNTTVTMANTHYLLDVQHTFINYTQTKATAPQKLSVTRDLDFHVQFLFTFTIHSTNQDVYN